MCQQNADNLWCVVLCGVVQGRPARVVDRVDLNAGRENKLVGSSQSIVPRCIVQRPHIVLQRSESKGGKHKCTNVVAEVEVGVVVEQVPDHLGCVVSSRHVQR